MKFVVEKEIFEKLPTACFGVVVAKGIDNGKSYPTVDALLDESIAAAAAHFEGKKVKEEPEILPYREAFRALGINPNKFMCSIEALFTRIAKGKGMPHINPIVDLGNAVSLKYTLPMGAHDLSAGSDGRGVPGCRRGRLRRRQSGAYPPLDVAPERARQDRGRFVLHFLPHRRLHRLQQGAGARRARGAAAACEGDFRLRGDRGLCGRGASGDGCYALIVR